MNPLQTTTISATASSKNFVSIFHKKGFVRSLFFTHAILGSAVVAMGDQGHTKPFGLRSRASSFRWPLHVQRRCEKETPYESLLVENRNKAAVDIRRCCRKRAGGEQPIDDPLKKNT
jgi:hypothetical protein